MLEEANEKRPVTVVGTQDPPLPPFAEPKHIHDRTDTSNPDQQALMSPRLLDICGTKNLMNLAREGIDLTLSLSNVLPEGAKRLCEGLEAMK